MERADDTGVKIKFGRGRISTCPVLPDQDRGRDAFGRRQNWSIPSMAGRRIVFIIIAIGQVIIIIIKLYNRMLLKYD